MIQGPEVVITPKGENLKWKSLAKKKGDNLFYFGNITVFHTWKSPCLSNWCIFSWWLSWSGQKKCKNMWIRFHVVLPFFFIGHPQSGVGYYFTNTTDTWHWKLIVPFVLCGGGRNGDIFTVSVVMQVGEWDISLKLIDWVFTMLLFRTHTNILLSKTSFKY